MLCSLRVIRATGSGSDARHAAAGGLGDGQLDELVADDLVREAERTLELVEGSGRRDRLHDQVVPGLLALDGVRELALAPPVGPAVDGAPGGVDAVGDDLDEGLRLRV